MCAGAITILSIRPKAASPILWCSGFDCMSWVWVFNPSSTRAELHTHTAFNGALPKLGSSSKSGSPPTCPPEAHGTASRTRPGRDRGAASGSLVLCTEPTQPQNRRPASPSQRLTCGVASGRHARSTGPGVVSSATCRRSSLNIWTGVAGRATFLRVCVTVSTE